MDDLALPATHRHEQVVEGDTGLELRQVYPQIGGAPDSGPLTASRHNTPQGGIARLAQLVAHAHDRRQLRADHLRTVRHGAGHAAIVREIAAEFAIPLLIATGLGLPLAAWLGQQYLEGFVDRVDLFNGVVLPTMAATTATLFVTAFVALRHLRQAVALQPVEALR